MSDTQVCKGITKWFDKKKGWGYITKDDGKDFFVHYTNIKLLDKEGKERSGFKTLEANQAVSFEIKEDKKGPQAVNVIVV